MEIRLRGSRQYYTDYTILVYCLVVTGGMLILCLLHGLHVGDVDEREMRVRRSGSVMQRRTDSDV